MAVPIEREPPVTRAVLPARGRDWEFTVVFAVVFMVSLRLVAEESLGGVTVAHLLRRD